MEKVKQQKVFQRLWPIEYYKKIQTQQKCQPLKSLHTELSPVSAVT